LNDEDDAKSQRVMQAMLQMGKIEIQKLKEAYERLLPTIRSRTKMLPKLREFRRPVRIIFGDADPYLNKGVAQRFHELFPVSELFLVPGARHFVQMDEAAQVARLILAMPRRDSEQV